MGHLGVIATSVGVQKIFCSVVRSNKYVFGRCLEEMLFSSWNTMVIEMSLLDFLAYKTGCQVGELPTVAKEDPIWISHSVMWMKPDTESLSDGTTHWTTCSICRQPNPVRKRRISCSWLFIVTKVAAPHDFLRKPQAPCFSYG